MGTGLRLRCGIGGETLKRDWFPETRIDVGLTGGGRIGSTESDVQANVGWRETTHKYFPKCRCMLVVVVVVMLS